MQFEYNDEPIYVNANNLKSKDRTALPIRLPPVNTTDILSAHEVPVEYKRNLSDPILSPSLLFTPTMNTYTSNEPFSGGQSVGASDSNGNYIHYSHQHQNSISSLSSSIFNPNSASTSLNHGAGSSTTISDNYFFHNPSVASSNGQYSNEPLTPPDYFGHSSNGGGIDSHSRKNSMSGSIWNQTPSFSLYSPWTTGSLINTPNPNNNSHITATSVPMPTANTGNSAVLGMGLNVSGVVTAGSISTASGTELADNSVLTVDQTPLNPTTALDDIQQQKFRKQRFSSGNVSMSGFEKQFQQLSVGGGPQLTGPVSISLDPLQQINSSAQQASSQYIQRRSMTYPASSMTTLDDSTDILALAKDQYGCRFLQKKIDEDFQTNSPLIFQAVYQHSTELMVDPFGNYLIQKIMTTATDEQLNLILINISPSILTVSKNQHGTRACQKLIDCLTTQTHQQLLEECLSPYIVNLIRDLNGNHVVQKCIHKLHNEDLQFIIDSICENMIKISTHKHGCCVLQKLLNKCNHQQVIQLGQEIVRNSIILMQDQFGNYVVQYLITLDIYELNTELVKIMVPYICELSVQKFSSNVVEKCLKIQLNSNSNNTSNDHFNPLFETLLQPAILTTLIKDQYGNYVIQTAMSLSPYEYKVRFANAIKPLLPLVRFTSFGKRINNKVMTITNELEKAGGQENSRYPGADSSVQYQEYGDASGFGLLPPIDLNGSVNYNHANTNRNNEYSNQSDVEKFL